MVLGVNDSQQIKNESFRTNKNILEYLLKGESYRALRHGKDVIFRNQISKANLICIFGSSLGDSDNNWWELIGQQLMGDCYLIIFDVCNEEVDGIMINRFKRDVLIKFRRKAKMTNEQFNVIEEKILVNLNSNMFNLI